MKPIRQKDVVVDSMALLLLLLPLVTLLAMHTYVQLVKVFAMFIAAITYNNDINKQPSSSVYPWLL